MKCRGILEKIFLFPNHALNNHARIETENQRYDFSGNTHSSALISQQRQARSNQQGQSPNKDSPRDGIQYRPGGSIFINVVCDLGTFH